jgi:hypothetical protein
MNGNGATIAVTPKTPKSKKTPAKSTPKTPASKKRKLATAMPDTKEDANMDSDTIKTESKLNEGSIFGEGHDDIAV